MDNAFPLSKSRQKYRVVVSNWEETEWEKAIKNWIYIWHKLKNLLAQLKKNQQSEYMFKKTQYSKFF